MFDLLIAVKVKCFLFETTALFQPGEQQQQPK